MKVEAKIRAFLMSKRYSLMKKSARRLQLCVRQFLRNLHLRQRIQHLHRCCQSGQTEEVEAHLLHVPGDIAVRNKYLSYQTCLHTAVQFGQLAVMEMLKPSAFEILQKDINGNTALHHAAMLPNIDVVKFLERALFTKGKHSSAVGSAVAVADSTVSEVDLLAAGDESDEEADIAVAMLGKVHLGDKIMEGWLKKVLNDSIDLSHAYLLMCFWSSLLKECSELDYRNDGLSCTKSICCTSKTKAIRIQKD